MSQPLKLEDFDRRILGKGGTTNPPSRGSILLPWVMRMPLRVQGTLLTAIRNCDIAPQEPPDSHARKLVGAIRYGVLVPASPKEVDNPDGGFFYSEPPHPLDVVSFEAFPVHWFSHVMEASEVLGYAHPDLDFRDRFLTVYTKFADWMGHCRIEEEEAFWERIETKEKEDQESK